jgi:hypothetical protein
VISSHCKGGTEREEGDEAARANGAQLQRQARKKSREAGAGMASAIVLVVAWECSLRRLLATAGGEEEGEI